jgi:hypothetical protein
MKIDTNDYITMAEARELLDASPRGFYRAVRRAGLDKVTREFFGVRVVIKSKLSLIKENYFPVGSERRSTAAAEWGAAGGATKARNRAAKRSP